jgi:hypothetical protein
LAWIGNKFVINPGSGRRTLRLRQIIPLLLEAEKFEKQFVLIQLFKKQALKWTRSVCLRAFYRSERVAFYSV